MKIKVELLAFMNGEIREVEIPDDLKNITDDELFEKVFHYGQNDFQPVEGRCSVSAGDVIHYDGRKCFIAMTGFEDLSEETYLKYKSVPRRDRGLVQFTPNEELEGKINELAVN